MTQAPSIGITAPQGFAASGYAAGIKPSGNPDVAVVHNLGPHYTAAGVFTRNKVVASPVKLSKQVLADATVTSVLFNAGNANACNGRRGDADAKVSVERLASDLGVDAASVAVCSTGLIGEPMPMDRFLPGIDAAVERLGSDRTHGADAARAIMTTDTVPKETSVQGDGWVLGGMGKGVGMMAPSLATMLVCLTTDAVVPAPVAQQALERACAATFNTLDIDGTTSTNDTVLLLANGASGVIPGPDEFEAAVLEACADLAHQLQSDAEGVTKRVRITVTGADTNEQALTAARTIGRDNLFKCAMFGSDPNWGRVLAAVGMAEANMDPENISVWFNGHQVCKASGGTPDAREVDLSGDSIDVRVDLGCGGAGTAFVRTTDLSHAYVEINSAYSS